MWCEGAGRVRVRVRAGASFVCFSKIVIFYVFVKLYLLYVFVKLALCR